jgi:DHA3 family tetracycline resistance protein-like MFS transporter
VTPLSGTDETARRATRIFLWSGFVWRLCWSSYWTLFFVRLVVDVGLDPLQLLLLGTAKEVTILVTEIPTGIVADIRSRRMSVVLGFLICGVAIVGAGLADGFVLLAATQVLWAFGSTFRSGAETAWLTDEVGSVAAVDTILPRRGRFEAVGSIAGLLVMAVLASIAGLSAALVVVGALLAGWGVVLALRMPETGFVRHDASLRSRFRALLVDGFVASRRPGLRVLLTVTIITGFASEAVDRLHVARLDEIGLRDAIDPALLIGAASVLQSLGAIALLLILADALAGERLVRAMVGLNIATAAGVAVLARTDLLPIALAGVIVQGMVRDVARTVTVGWTNHFTDRSNRATVHSFVGQASSIGEISGGVVLGILAQRLGLGPALTASAVLYLFAAYWASRGRSRWSRPPAERRDRTGAAEITGGSGEGRQS